MDKSASRKRSPPRGKEYCDNPGTSCFYGPGDLCVNCGRKKGWRSSQPRKTGLDWYLTEEHALESARHWREEARETRKSPRQDYQDYSRTAYAVARSVLRRVREIRQEAERFRRG